MHTSLEAELRYPLCLMGFVKGKHMNLLALAGKEIWKKRAREQKQETQEEERRRKEEHSLKRVGAEVVLTICIWTYVTSTYYLGSDTSSVSRWHEIWASSPYVAGEKEESVCYWRHCNKGWWVGSRLAVLVASELEQNHSWLLLSLIIYSFETSILLPCVLWNSELFRNFPAFYHNLFRTLSLLCGALSKVELFSQPKHLQRSFNWSGSLHTARVHFLSLAFFLL